MIAVVLTARGVTTSDAATRKRYREHLARMLATDAQENGAAKPRRKASAKRKATAKK